MASNHWILHQLTRSTKLNHSLGTEVLFAASGITSSAIQHKKERAHDCLSVYACWWLLRVSSVSGVRYTPSINWHKYSACTHGGYHSLHIVLMMFLNTNAPLLQNLCFQTWNSYSYINSCTWIPWCYWCIYCIPHFQGMYWWCIPITCM